MPAFPPGTSKDVVVTTPDGTTGTLVKGWVSDFLDVPLGHIFHDFVVKLVSNGITVGVGDGSTTASTRAPSASRWRCSC